MRVAVFSSQPYERDLLDDASATSGHELVHVDAALTLQTAALAAGCEVASLFVRDDGSAEVLEALSALGVRALALRSAGFNHVDLEAAARLDLTIARVPSYSPHAIAEHAIALVLTLNRKLHRAYNRVREQNFSLGGLMGFDMHGKTAGVIGTGEIGAVACRILMGFGCEVLASDPSPSPECVEMGVDYVPLDELLARAHVVTLHCPLNPGTHHLIGARELALMRDDAMLVNTSRGAVIDSLALVDALKRSRIGSVALDVYEEEGDLFFRDLSDRVIDDDVFVRLMTFPNVLITAHQGFFTREAVSAIARTTLENVDAFSRGEVDPARAVTLALVSD